MTRRGEESCPVGRRSGHWSETAEFGAISPRFPQGEFRPVVGSPKWTNTCQSCREAGGRPSSRPTRATARGCGAARLRRSRSPQRPGFRPYRQYAAASRGIAGPRKSSGTSRTLSRNPPCHCNSNPYLSASSFSICPNARARESRVRHQCLNISVECDGAVNLGLYACVQHTSRLAEGWVRPAFAETLRRS